MASPAVELEPPLPRPALDAPRTTSDVLGAGVAAAAYAPDEGVADGEADALGVTVGPTPPAGAATPEAWVPDFCPVVEAAVVGAAAVEGAGSGAGAACFASHAWYPVALSHSVHGMDWPSA